MRFHELTEFSTKIEHSSGRLRMYSVTGDLFRRATAPEIAIIAYLANVGCFHLGRVWRPELGITWRSRPATPARSLSRCSRQRATRSSTLPVFTQHCAKSRRPPGAPVSRKRSDYWQDCCSAARPAKHVTCCVLSLERCVPGWVL